MKRAIALLLLLAGGLLNAQSGARIDSILFLPPEYYVGDTVEMRVEVEAPPGMLIDKPAALPQAEWILFRGAEVETREGGYELRLFFSPFAPGTRTLPEVAFGDFTLRGLKIHTTTILEEEDGDIADLRNQLYLPGTMLLLVLTMVLLFTGPLALIAASGFIRGRIRSLSLYWTRRRPYWRLKRDLKELSSQALLLPDRDFYYRLSDAVRTYISRRTGGDCISTTIHEIRVMMQKIFPEGDTALRLIHFLEYADMIKFAGIEAGEDKKGDDLLRLGDLVGQLEEQYRNREKEVDVDVDL